MALVSTFLDDFSGGMYRGKRAPANAAFDLQNLLINDEGLPVKRGGDAYKSNADAEQLDMLADVFVGAGQRTVFSSEQGGHLWVLGADDETPVQVGSCVRSLGRPAASTGLVFFPASPNDTFPARIYGGSRLGTGYATGTVTVTKDSQTVTGSGTSWLANADAGMIFGSSPTYGVVQSVDSDTQITLARPWTGPNASGQAYVLNVVLALDPAPLQAYGVDSSEDVFLTTAGISQRLVVAVRQRAYISGRNDPLTFDAADYLELASGGWVLGADAIGSNAVVFTTGGITVISNLDFDDVDAFGNIQWGEDKISREFVLWGDSGIASYSGSLIVPGVDDVCLFSGSKLDTITGGRGSQYDGGIRNLYRSYVSQGLIPGMATVHRAHYLLPIFDGSNVVDVLVCRLDHGFAWTRWAGHAAGVAFARRIGSTTRQPALLGVAGERVTDLTGAFSPDGSNVSDADGTVPQAQVVTRDLPTGQQPGFVTKIRARYEFDATEDQIGLPWVPDPWQEGDDAIRANGSLFSGGFAGSEWRSYLTTQTAVAPLVERLTIVSRPAVNINAAACSIIGFLQDPVAGNGYEARLRYEVAADTVTIERYDSGSRTRIMNAISLTDRIEFGDIFEFSVSAAGLLKIRVNGSLIGSVTDTTYFHAGEAAHAVVGILDQLTVAGVASDILMQSDDLPVPLVTPLVVEYSSDADDDVWTPLTELGEQGGAAGWTTSDGSRYQFAKVGKKRERIRFRITLAAAASSFVFRSLEMLSRTSGKQ